MLVRSKIAWRMFGVTEVLLPALLLTGVPGISRYSDETPLAYHHVLFKGHHVIFANGTETESLFGGEQALNAVGAAARTEIFAIFPEMRRMASQTAGARPFVYGPEGRKLVRRHLANDVPLVSPKDKDSCQSVA